MTILIMGGTGQVGSPIVKNLAEHGANVVVLTQDRAVKGDVLDPETMRRALRGVDTLFILNPVVADELTRALLTLRLAKDADLKGIVYFSMANMDALVTSRMRLPNLQASGSLNHWIFPRPFCAQTTFSRTMRWSRTLFSATGYMRCPSEMSAPRWSIFATSRMLQRSNF